MRSRAPRGDAPEIDGVVRIGGARLQTRPGEFIDVEITGADTYDLEAASDRVAPVNSTPRQQVARRLLRCHQALAGSRPSRSATPMAGSAYTPRAAVVGLDPRQRKIDQQTRGESPRRSACRACAGAAARSRCCKSASCAACSRSAAARSLREIGAGAARDRGPQLLAERHRQFRGNERACQRRIQRLLECCITRGIGRLVHVLSSSHSLASPSPSARTRSNSIARARWSSVFTVPSGWPSIAATSATDRSS